MNKRKYLHQPRPEGNQPRSDARHTVQPADAQQPVEGGKKRRMRKAANPRVRLPLPGDEASAAIRGWVDKTK